MYNSSPWKQDFQPNSRTLEDFQNPILGHQRIFNPILGHQRVIGGHCVVNGDRPDGLQVT